MDASLRWRRAETAMARLRLRWPGRHDDRPAVGPGDRAGRTGLNRSGCRGFDLGDEGVRLAREIPDPGRRGAMVLELGCVENGSDLSGQSVAPGQPAVELPVGRHVGAVVPGGSADDAGRRDPEAGHAWPAEPGGQL